MLIELNPNLGLTQHEEDMDRTLEPELMDDPEQALVYARADFEKENQGFVDRFREYFPEFAGGHIIDLGCGPGDIPVRLAWALPSCRITAVDASEPMIRLAEECVHRAGLSDRITFRCERFQDLAGVSFADAAISNSLLHHVPNHLQFWHTLRLAVNPGSVLLVMVLVIQAAPDVGHDI